MFPIGTQISVLMSTANKKLSPRRGSVGYISGTGRTKFLTDDYESGLVATPLSIIFTKYGNESKLRRERRVILNIIPIESTNTKQNAKKNIKVLEDNFNKRVSFFKKHAENNGAICSGTVIPNNSLYNIMKSDETEIRAWVQSHIDHYHFNKAVPNILKRLGYSQGFISILLRDYTELHLHDVITALRASVTTYNARNHASYLIAFKHMLSYGKDYPGHIKQEEFFNMYIKDFFDKEKSKEKEEVVRKYSVRKSQCITATNMNEVSIALLNHSKGA
jgi:hypothetical protein